MSKQKKSVDSTIMAAIITGIVTIAVTAITVFGSQLANKPDPTPAPPPTVVITNTLEPSPSPVPTTTVPPGEPTSTPAPATDTPVPTFTVVPPPAIGADWAQNCVSALWTPYRGVPAVKDGCYSPPVSEFFFPENGRLTFLVDKRSDESIVYGIFAPLPSSGSAEIKVNLKDLTNGEIWIGIFAEPTIDAQGMIMVIPPGDVSNSLFRYKAMPGEKERQKSAFFRQNNAYHLRFDFTPGTVKATVEPNAFVTNSTALSSAQKYLFIGFQLKKGSNRVSGDFRELVITSR